MTRLTAYKVVSALYRSEEGDDVRNRLSQRANDHIATGWQSHGAMRRADLGGRFVVAKPLIRTEGA